MTQKIYENEHAQISLGASCTRRTAVLTVLVVNKKSEFGGLDGLAGKKIGIEPDSMYEMWAHHTFAANLA